MDNKRISLVFALKVKRREDRRVLLSLIMVV